MAVRLLSMAATRRGEAGPRCQKNAQNLWRVSVVSMFMLSVVMLRETAENGCGCFSGRHLHTPQGPQELRLAAFLPL